MRDRLAVHSAVAARGHARHANSKLADCSAAHADDGGLGARFSVFTRSMQRQRRRSVAVARRRTDAPSAAVEPIAVAAPAPTPDPVVPPERVQDTLCYICRNPEPEEPWRLVACPECVLSAHDACLCAAEAIRIYGSLKNAFGHNYYRERVGVQLACAHGHNLFQAIPFSQYVIEKKTGATFSPPRVDVIKSVVTLALGAFFLWAAWNVSPHYFLPLALALTFVWLGMLVAFEYVTGVDFIVADQRIQAWLSVPAFFALHSALSLIHEHVPWIKVLLPATVIVMKTRLVDDDLLLVMGTPVLWISGTRMTEWVTPWLCEQVAIGATTLVLVAATAWFLLSPRIDYELKMVERHE